MRKILLPILLAITAAPSAQAYTVLGVATCAEVTAGEGDPATEAAHTAWILGYMTARNAAEDAASGDGLPDGVMYGMLLQFCADNPAADLEAGGQFVFEGLK